MLVLATLIAGASAVASLGPADLARAYTPRPLPSSHVIGSGGKQIFDAMNRHLLNQPVATRPCEDWKHWELNEVARKVYSLRDDRLSTIYKDAGDNRKFHFEDLNYKEQLWALEDQQAKLNPSQFGPGSEKHAVSRDGKCAEMVMWWVHHLNEETRQALQSVHGFTIPLLPANGLKKTEDPEYVYQVSCSDCHSTGFDSLNSTVPKVPVKRTEAIATCPIDNTTGLPTVWYQPMSNVGNRRKRCDWDYDPPCQMCEGVGGWIWGEQEDEISYTSCTPLMEAADIPKDNITSPVWPLHFTVDEVTVLINQLDTGGRFPGAEPCALHNFKNDTERFYYDGILPFMRIDTGSGTKIWSLPDNNMFIKINAIDLCLCVTPFQSHTDIPTGPLEHDFAKDATLVGREVIGLEGLNTTSVADHWNKGPHHFWVDVATNRMVRGWQPYNGLNIYYNWNYTTPEPVNFVVDKSCIKGPGFRKNTSCEHPYPDPEHPSVRLPTSITQYPGLHK